MLGFGTLAKLRNGGIGPDEFAELLSTLGINAAFDTVDGDPLPCFQQIADATAQPSTQLMRIRMEMKGQKFEGLLVVSENS